MIAIDRPENVSVAAAPDVPVVISAPPNAPLSLVVDQPVA